MSAYTLLGKSPLLTTSFADRPFDESLKTILNLVPNKMKFSPIHYFSPDDLIIGTTKVSLFNPVLSGRGLSRNSTRAREACDCIAPGDSNVLSDSPPGWSLGCVSAIGSNGRTIWIADAHRDDGKRFVVRADES
jgi:hypothetical protein